MERSIVKLGVSKTKTGLRYIVTVPKRCIEELKWNKGEYLGVSMIEYEIDGKRYKGVFYYKILET
jgi:hypothetical protein